MASDIRDGVTPPLPPKHRYSRLSDLGIEEEKGAAGRLASTARSKVIMNSLDIEPNTTPTLKAAYVDTDSAALYLSVAPKTLRNWVSAGVGPSCHRFGRAVRYSVADLDNWAEGQRAS